MKKFIFSIVLIFVVVFVVIFHRQILQEIGQLEVVQNISAKIAGVEPANEDVSDAGTGYYAYETLTSEEKLVYNQMAECLFELKNEITISTRNESVADQAFQCLMSDHPEIFWTSAYELTSYKVSGMDTDYVFKPIYIMSSTEVEEYQSIIDEEVKKCFQEMPSTDDEYAVAKYVFEYIILHTDYNKNAQHNQNICSVFGEQESVCMGYSKAYQYLLQEQGIQSVIVAGESDDEAHAWNLVRLNGEYYYVDVTWGDPQFSAIEEQDTGYIDYSFLGMDTEDLLKTHSIDNVFVVPECTARNCNYYVKEGLYLDKFDEDEICRMIEQQLSNYSFVSIRCHSEEIYWELYEYLIKESNICDFIESDTVSYIENDVYYTLNIFKP